MHVTELCRRLLAKNEHDFVARNRRQLEWIAGLLPLGTALQGEAVGGLLLKSILGYDALSGWTTPDSKAVVDYSVSNVTAPKEGGRPLDNAAVNLLEENVAQLPALATGLETLDLNVLFAECFSKIRGTLYSNWAEKFARIASGTETYKPSRGVELPGTPETAMAFLLERQRTHDFAPVPRRPSGLLHEHAEWALEYAKRVSGGEGSGDALPLGYDHIDTNFTVDKKDGGFVGVLGPAKMGKTTFVDSVVYNWLEAGKNVCYVTYEHQAPNVAFKVLLKYAASRPDLAEGLRLPSLWQWKQRMGTKEHLALLEKLVGCVKRMELPGRLDIQNIDEWEAVKGHLVARDPVNKYDALVVDYFRRMKLPPKNPNEAMAAIIQDAQGLSRSFMGRGLVIITPIEVNRESSKEARGDAQKAAQGQAQGQGQNKRRWTRDAIRQDTAFQYALDLCLGVFSTPEMRDQNKIEVEGVFVREGKEPPNETMRVDPETAQVEYPKGYTSKELEVPGWAGDSSAPSQPMDETPIDDL